MTVQLNKGMKQTKLDLLERDQKQQAELLEMNERMSDRADQILKDVRLYFEA